MKTCTIIGKTNVGKTVFFLNFTKYLGANLFEIEYINIDGTKTREKLNHRQAVLKLVDNKTHKTRCIQSLVVNMPMGKGKKKIQLIDTAGLIDRIHPDSNIRKSISQTLSVIRESDVVLHIIDASTAKRKELPSSMGEVDYQVAQFAQLKRSYAILANKMDLPEAELGLEKVRAEFRGNFIIPISALYKKGLEVEIVRADVRDVDSLMRAFEGAEMVFHLAGIVSISKRNTSLLYEINVNGTENVVKACINSGVRRLVYTSSVHAFIENPDNNIIDESTEINPDKITGDYSKSKAKATLQVLKSVEQDGLDAVIVCPTGIIGPYDYKMSEMGRLILDLVNGKMKLYFDGGYDFVDVRDVAKGLILAGDKGRTGEMYILSGEWITIGELVNILQNLIGFDFGMKKMPLWLTWSAARLADIYYLAVKSKPIFNTYSIRVLTLSSPISGKKARDKLEFEARPLKESFKDSIEWFRNTGHLPEDTFQNREHGK
jgi:dihydroflavonol-4-reductase